MDFKSGEFHGQEIKEAKPEHRSGSFSAAQLQERLYPASEAVGLPVGETRNKAVDEESKLLNEIQGPLWDEQKNYSVGI